MSHVRRQKGLTAEDSAGRRGPSEQQMDGYMRDRKRSDDPMHNFKDVTGDL